MGLFKLMTNVDKFEEHYRRTLSRRLLSEKSNNSDNEKNIVTRFKVLMKVILSMQFFNILFFSPSVVGNSQLIWKKCLRTWSSQLICRANSVSTSPTTYAIINHIFIVKFIFSFHRFYRICSMTCE